MAQISRRAAIGGMSAGAVGLGVGGGVGALLGRQSSDVGGPTPAGTTTAGTTSTTPGSVAAWRAQRGRHYFIGHRGSGDVYPEHSIEGYRAAVESGAGCLEISVGMTSDGTLICLHDPTYDRTTTITGTVGALPSTVLRSARLRAPQLGPAWATEPVPQVPRLLDVLRELGGEVVMCIEAKNDAAYPAVIAAIEKAGLGDGVIVKAGYSSPRIREARAAGYPVFGYFGVESDLSLARITALAAQLDRRTDCIVLPTYGAGGFVDTGFVSHAVATGIPVWVYGTHRRSDVHRFFGLGCQGVVASSVGYLMADRSIATTDTWASGAIAPGEMTKDPSSAGYAPRWSDDELQLPAQQVQHFLTLGQLSPLPAAAGSYRVRLQACWLTRPENTSDNLTLAFGRVDDSYYEHRSGSGDGYHAILRADGRLELYRHVDGRRDGVALGSAVPTPPPAAGQWIDLELQVTPTSIRWSRTDVRAAVTGSDSTVRGGYLHVGRSSPDGVLAFRSLSVS